MAAQLGLQIALPTLLLIGLARGRYGSVLDWLLGTLSTGATLLFVFLAARWDFTSYHLRTVEVVLLIAASWAGYRSTMDRLTEGTVTSRLSMFWSLLLLVVFGACSAFAIAGRTEPPDAIALTYPLHGKGYYVTQGGTSRLLNAHASLASQEYAIDIVRLNAFGNRGSEPVPASLDGFVVYGDTVYAPCEGTVEQVVSALPDPAPPARNPDRPLGNLVALSCQGIRVVVANLMEQSVRVSQGEFVLRGDPIARVGNSGDSDQPHLHLHAERGGVAGRTLVGEAAPVTIGGRYLVRNSRFRGY